jgi:integrase/recombinase XerD
MGVYYALRQRAKKADVATPVHPHTLRHCHITLALRGGAKLQDVQRAIGHKRPETTMRYYHSEDIVGKSPGRFIELDTPTEA